MRDQHGKKGRAIGIPQAAADQEEARAFYGRPGPNTTIHAPLPFLDRLPRDTEGLVRLMRSGFVESIAEPTPVGPGRRGVTPRILRDLAESLEGGKPRLRPTRATSIEAALLLCALLRGRGLPARLRCGFLGADDDAAMFSPVSGCEMWSGAENRWRLYDVRKAAGLAALEFPPGSFIPAGHAWTNARQRIVDPRRFGLGRHRGLGFIRGQLLRDCLALLAVELPPADSRLRPTTTAGISAAEAEWLDRIAIATNHPILAELGSLVAQSAWLNRLLSEERQKALTTLNTADPPPSPSEQSSARLSIVLQEIPPSRMRRARHALQPRSLELVAPPDAILIRGARQNNLNIIDLQIPLHRLVVVTGVSGSGKSSLVFDTLYAESRRRFLENFSTFGRQFMERVARPKADAISGLPPAIAIEQKQLGRNPRSTVGTSTDILDYLRLLFSRVGLADDPDTGTPFRRWTVDAVVERLNALPGGTSFALRSRPMTATSANLERARELGISQALTPDGARLLDQVTEGSPVEFLLGAFGRPDEATNNQFHSEVLVAVRMAFALPDGVLVVVLPKNERVYFASRPVDPRTGEPAPSLTAQHFSRNSPYGMCAACRGLGFCMRVDRESLVANPAISILDGALSWYGPMRQGKRSWWPLGPLDIIAAHYHTNLELPWNRLPNAFRRTIIDGSEGKSVRLPRPTGGFTDRPVHGLVREIERLYHESTSPAARAKYAQFMAQSTCAECAGSGLNRSSRSVYIDGRNIAEISSLPASRLLTWIQQLAETLDDDFFAVAEEILTEIHTRVRAMADVGLAHLSLSRPVSTLSGGEAQRLRLSTQITAGLTGVLYILDEPTIGLHPCDEEALLATLDRLLAGGNSLLVVEHDLTMIRRADWLIDMGPGAGSRGGRVLAAGTPAQVATNAASITGPHLRPAAVPAPMRKPRRPDARWITLTGARLHNLKSVKLQIPVGLLTGVTGVSGSGKSNLIDRTLQPALERALGSTDGRRPGPFDRLIGVEHIAATVSITQAPIGRTPRSNPATFLGFFDHIRKLFGRQPDAARRHWTAADFSFNSEGGRCPTCKGHGQLRIEMHFLADVWITCPDCEGRRYRPEILAVHFRHRSIYDVLEMEIDEALAFFEDHAPIRESLALLHEVGLGYLRLGQSATTLSGGEAQRLKIARELAAASARPTLYTLDEPTTGLHIDDIRVLLRVIDRLVIAGHTVVLVEHNLEVIRQCDWVVDLGPGGGDDGGRIVVAGPPATVASAAASVTGPFLAAALKGALSTPINSTLTS